MTQSDVRDLDSLDALRQAVERLADRMCLSSQSIHATLNRVDEHFSVNQVTYWRDQTRVAERELTSAQDQLSRKRSTVRPGDRVPATEEAKNVARWKNRLRLCQEKERLARRISIEIQQVCEKTRGPSAALAELGEVALPTAANRLLSLIDRLRAYQDGQDLG
ncbi:hypothetical protein [Rhodopirellula europaea]|uniref:Uncharacterized protein n=1 Tax=Rhodopirellula europaea 6C TaxID=1263867 RepID=M2B2X2_9BACT|nr:hypothetical protein [Rhodopirellula europaea]EMB19262.1 hypothetical protein RE6C_00026 [Rhodopirellula europaea 6C]